MTKFNAVKLALAAVALSAAYSASAATLTVNGTITPQTCTIAAANINQTVTLPTVGPSDLLNASNLSPVTFQFGLSGCDASYSTAAVTPRGTTAASDVTGFTSVVVAPAPPPTSVSVSSAPPPSAVSRQARCRWAPSVPPPPDRNHLQSRHPVPESADCAAGSGHAGSGRYGGRGRHGDLYLRVMRDVSPPCFRGRHPETRGLSGCTPPVNFVPFLYGAVSYCLKSCWGRYVITLQFSFSPGPRPVFVPHRDNPAGLSAGPLFRTDDAAGPCGRRGVRVRDR